MRIRRSTLGKPESESPALQPTARPDLITAWNAIFSTIEHILTQILYTKYLNESRTSDTQILRAIVSAREAVRVKLTRRIT